MATYYVNGNKFKVSVYGLRIESDSDKENVFFLDPIDNNWEKYFSADSNWIASKNRAIIVYASENNLRKVDRLVYIYWEQVGNPNNVEIEVDINETDRAYLNGLLVQWFGKHIESQSIDFNVRQHRLYEGSYVGSVDKFFIHAIVPRHVETVCLLSRK